MDYLEKMDETLKRIVEAGKYLAETQLFLEVNQWIKKLCIFLTASTERIPFN